MLADEYPFIRLGNNGLSLTVGAGRHSSNYQNRIQMVLSTNSGGTGYAGFQVFTSGAPTDLLRVKENGFIGIGTSSPSSKLEISDGLGAGTSSMIRLSRDQASGFGTTEFKQYYTSGSDYGLRIGNSVNDWFTLNGSNGNLGLGTSSPSYKLDVAGQVRSSSGGFVFPDGTVQTTAATGSGSSQWTTASTNIYYNTGNVGIGTTNPAYKLDVAGDLNASGAITGGTINAKYQDVAEWVPSRQRLASGTVVILDPERTNQVIASTESYDTRVAGVISEQPGVLLGEGGEGKVKVATTGRVRVKVDATRGAIKIGDLLVASNEAGVAMKSEPVNVGGVLFHRPGTIIGKALEPLAKGKGEILVLLSLQ